MKARIFNMPVVMPGDRRHTLEVTPYSATSGRVNTRTNDSVIINNIFYTFAFNWRVENDKITVDATTHGMHSATQFNPPTSAALYKIQKLLEMELKEYLLGITNPAWTEAVLEQEVYRAEQRKMQAALNLRIATDEYQRVLAENTQAQDIWGLADANLHRFRQAEHTNFPAWHPIDDASNDPNSLRD